MKKNKGYFIIFVISLIFAFFLTLQLRSVSNNTKIVDDMETLRSSELQAKLNRELEKNSALTEELTGYKDQLEKYRDEAANAGDYSQILNEELERAELLAGLTDVYGPGVIVTMEDATGDEIADGGGLVDPNVSIIHDSDILSVLNELRDAGADALSLNGERILATTEIRCAGAIVSVNNQRYSTPFIIQAIGDPDTLKSALLMPSGVVDYLSNFGISVKVEQKDNIEIDQYSGSLQYKYAKQAE